MIQNKNQNENLQPSGPSRQACAGVVGDPVLAEPVDAAVGHALVDVGRADVVLEAVRTLTLEDLAGILTDAAVLALLLVAEHAAFHGNILTGFDHETIGGSCVDLLIN